MLFLSDGGAEQHDQLCAVLVVRSVHADHLIWQQRFLQAILCLRADFGSKTPKPSPPCDFNNEKHGMPVKPSPTQIMLRSGIRLSSREEELVDEHQIPKRIFRSKARVDLEDVARLCA